MKFFVYFDSEPLVPIGAQRFLNKKCWDDYLKVNYPSLTGDN
jgi:hypothetical protein